jgi:hypothetical protein
VVGAPAQRCHDSELPQPFQPARVFDLQRTYRTSTLTTLNAKHAAVQRATLHRHWSKETSVWEQTCYNRGLVRHMEARTGVAVSSTKAAHRVFSQCTRYATHRPLATKKPMASTTNATRPAATDGALLAATSSAAQGMNLESTGGNRNTEHSEDNTR